MKINYPIILIVYNRPDHTKKILSQLNNFKIKKLYIISDGPKAKSLDIKNVEKTRKIVDEYLIKSKIKFKFKIYSNKNLGLRKRIISGLNTVFKREKVSIILEDDCIPTKDFFNFIDVMLKKFKNDRTIASIGGSNYFPKFRVNSSYLKSKYFNPWGWATWKRAWKFFNPDGYELIEVLKKKNQIRSFNFNNNMAYFKMLKDQVKGKNDSWAVRWYASAFTKEMYCLYPGKSFVSNIGLDGSGTHCSISEDYQVNLSPNIIIEKMQIIQENQLAKKKFEFFFKRLKQNFFRKFFKSLKSYFEGNN